MKVEFKLTGRTPILFHRDDIASSDEVSAWRDNPANKKIKVNGDDRWPAWTWMTYLHYDAEKGVVAIPFEVISSNLSRAGRKMTAKGNRRASLKAEACTSIIGVDETIEFFEFFGPKGKVHIADIEKMKDVLTYKEMVDAVEELGFSLFAKRAKIGKAKHVRIRPRFSKWAVRGTIQVEGQEFDFDTLKELFRLAGNGGLLDWRPWSPESPGIYGQFDSELKRV